MTPADDNNEYWGNSMKKTLLAAGSAALTMLLGPAIAQADDHESPGVTPVETYVCKFQEGKSMQDLDGVIKDWNRFMDRNAGKSGYQAILLLPSFYGERNFDVGWVGFAQDAKSLGQALDTWRDKGGEMAAAFAEVIDCPARTNYASLSVAEGSGKMPPNPVLTFSDCTVKDGVDMEAAIDAVHEWAKWRKEGGQDGPSWIWFPGYGENLDAEYDFKFLEGFENYEDWGADWDLYGNGGGWQKARELFSEKLECNSGRVYDVKAVRIDD